MRRVYISGRMTGMPEYNYPAFHAAARRLRDLGFDVANPAEAPSPGSNTWLDYMRDAIALLVRCDGVAMLAGWQESRGARIEHDLAVSLGLVVMREADILVGPEVCDA